MDHNSELIGWVGVDSGQIFLVDPCYLSDWQHGDFKTEGDDSDSYARVTTVMLRQRYGEVEGGVIVCCPGGDGVYPVHVITDDIGQVLRVEIVFADEEEDSVNEE